MTKKSFKCERENCPIEKEHIHIEHEERTSDKYDPEKNEDAIAIWKEKDGNYRGMMQKNGKMVKARTNDPQTVLLHLLTTDGNND